MATTKTESRDQLVELGGRLRLAIVRMARRLRQEAGSELSPSQASALATLDRSGPLTPSELAERERIQRPTATRVISRLEEAGLAERTADVADGRSHLLSTTARGTALLRRLRGRKNAYLARRMRELEPEEVAVLADAAEILERLLEGERR
jgi:DNA-binding MarR family transcriptional regulator